MTCDREIEYIQFGIASAEEILAFSVVQLTDPDPKNSNSVYDERMGPLTNSKCIVCFQQANQCSGHFGHIVLAEPILNPLAMFSSMFVNIANIFCNNCSALLLESLPRARQKRNESFLSVVAAKSKGEACHACHAIQDPILLDSTGILYHASGKRVDTRRLVERMKLIDRSTLKSCGINAKYAHPANYMLSVLPVLPHMNRPSISQGAKICDDDLTTLYTDIIKNTNKAVALDSGSSQYLTLVEKVVYSIRILFNNSSGIAKHPSSGRKLKGICERMSGKDGLYRNNCMGKRSDQTARAVASPGPDLTTGQVGLPRMIARILTRAIKCTEANLAEMQKLCNDNNVIRITRQVNGVECEFGVLKFCNQKQTKLERGDVIQRQTLCSMQPFELIPVESGHEVLIEGDEIIRDGQVIKTSPNRVRSFKVLDGDIVSRCLEDGDLVLINRQPTLHTGSISAAEIVIHDDFTIKAPLSLTERFNLDFDGDELNVHVVQSEEAYLELKNIVHADKMIISPSTGKPFMTIVQDTVLSLYLMTKESNLVDQDLITIEFERINQVRRCLGIGQENDSLALFSSTLPETLTVDHDKFQIVCGVWISGVVTKSISSMITTIVQYEFGNEAVARMVTKWQHVGVEWLTRRGFTIDPTDVEPIPRELIKGLVIERLESGETTRNIRDEMHAIAIKANKTNHILDCVESGAKGSLVNIGQICAIVGQQQYKNGAIIGASLSNDRVLPSDLETTSVYEKALKHGFVINSFASGLTAREYVVHAIPSRESIVNTATGTAETGYLQHRLVKIVNDLKYVDGQVINLSSVPKTVSLNYNNHRDPHDAIPDDQYLKFRMQMIKK